MRAYEAYCLLKNNSSKSKRNKDCYESIIATIPVYSYDYAYYILEDRFQLGEKIIATDAYYSYMYARNVLNSRFELGEYVIFSDRYYFRRYINDMMRDKIPIYYKFI